MIYNSHLLDAAQDGAAGSTFIWVIYFVVIGAIMYFMLIRPQRKRTKEEKQLRESIQIGDEIVTIGGIHGRIISLKEDTIVIESKSDHSKLTIARWAIQANLTKHEDDKTAEKKKTVTSKEKKKDKKPQEKTDGKLN